MRWDYNFHAWLHRHQRLARVIAVLLALALGLTTLTYLGNQSVGFPDGVPVVGSIPRLPLLPPAADCVRDPALAEPTLISPPGPGPDGWPSNYLHTCGRRLYDSEGREVMITGLNWFGMETGTYAPHGLWTRNWQAVLDQIAGLGYNTIRLPYSNEVFAASGSSAAINYLINPDLQGLTGVTLLDKLIAGARQRGLKIVLDRHRPTSAAQSALWYTEEVGEQRWIDDWVKLAQRYANNDTVIAFDLHNEPRESATWGNGDPATDWQLAAERAANAILDANPYLLVFVEGVSSYRNDYYWWGGHLGGVAQHPIRLKVPNRVVYSPHDYGPEVFAQGWFQDPTFPRNLPAVWDAHWGYIARQDIAPVVVGEFGGRSVGDDPEGVWQRALLDYMHRNHIGFFNWSLNPNSGDTGGLLSDDWLSVIGDKQNVYRTYLAPPIGTSPTGRLSPPAGKYRVLYRAMSVDPHTANISFSLQVANDGPQALDLGHVEVRYWFQAGRLGRRQQLAEIDYAALGKEHVTADVIASQRQGQDSYLRLSFDRGAPPVAPYQTSGEIMVRIHKSDWSTYLQSDAFSFIPQTNWLEADRIALYRDGQLVWGNEPPSQDVATDR